MATKFASLTYTDNFGSFEDAVEEARRLRKAFSGQHIKCVIRDEVNEDYILIDGIAHWYLRKDFFIEILVHKESGYIPF